jgi:hypothetical protein
MLILWSAVFTTLLAPVPPEKAPPVLVITDKAGKEYKAKTYTFKDGVVHLSWLAPAEAKPAKDKDKDKDKGKKPAPSSAKVGPQALVIREGSKFGVADGVVTFVPLDIARSVEFDPEMKTVTITVATSGEDVKLAGSTAYKGINKLFIEAEVDKGTAGVAEAAYEGGVPDGNLKSVKFPGTKPKELKGRAAVVVTSDKGSKRTDKVFNLTPVYVMPSGRMLADNTLLFKKTLRLDVTKLAKIAATKEEAYEPIWKVTPKGEEEEAYTLLMEGTIADQKARLFGLVGRVPEGYRLFPARRIVSIEFDKAEEFKGGKELKTPRELKE